MADRQFNKNTEPVAVVLPTYNEAENIETLIREILARDPAGQSTARVESNQDPQYRVIVVDDSSPDGTGRLVRGMMEKDARIDLVEREGKLGLGTAYVAGYRRAMELGAEWIFTMDADFSHDPKYIPEILAATVNADLVIGSRYVPGGGLRNWPFYRRWLSACANLLARLVLRLPNHDCTSGYRCYRASLLQKIPLDEITSDGYSFLIDVLYRCRRVGARVAESPIVFSDRRGGQSKISKTEIFKAFQTLWTLRTKKF